MRKGEVAVQEKERMERQRECEDRHFTLKPFPTHAYSSLPFYASS